MQGREVIMNQIRQEPSLQLHSEVEQTQSAYRRQTETKRGQIDQLKLSTLE